MKRVTQPVVLAADGVIRFRANEVVRYLLDEATAGRACDMHILARHKFSQEDREQFAQLIGYSVSGYGDLSYVSDESYNAAARAAAALRSRK